MKHLLVPFALLVLGACGTSSDPSGLKRTELTDQAGLERVASVADEAVPALPQERKIIRTGELRYEVDDLDAARNSVLQHVKATGGYVEGDERGDWGRSLSLTLRVRIPADGFDAFVQGLQGLGRLEQQNISATDVTTEWVDVEARLEAKRAVEKRYLELAGQAKNVHEMLEVERELGNVRSEIESMEARMKSMRDQVAMSALTITCSKEQALAERFSPKFGVAFKEGWNNLLRFTVALTNLWPFVVLTVALLWWWRRRRARRAK